jgi:tight adherence protein B
VTRSGGARAGLICLLVCLTCLITGLAARPAQAAAIPGTIVNAAASADGHSLDVLFEAGPKGANLEIDKNSVMVSLRTGDGRTVPLKPSSSGVVTPGDPGTTPTKLSRSVMLAIDTSDSMDTNGYFKVAQAAARTFVRSLPPDVKVGIVTFGDPARLVLSPTPDRTKVVNEINGLKTKGDTAMYEAVTKAVKAMGGASGRTIVMLTDGKNEDLTLPMTSDAQAKAALVGSKSRSSVDFAGILVGNQPRESIDKIAGRDAVTAYTDTTDLPTLLKKFFGDRTTNIARQVQVRVAIPPDLADQTVNVRVDARTVDNQPVVAISSGLTPLPAASRATPEANPVVVPPDRRLTAVSTPIVAGALLALFLALAILIFVATGALTGSAEPESHVVRRLSMYTLASARPQQISVTEQTTRLGDSALARSAVGLMSRVARTGQLERALDSRLEAAGLPLRTAEWMLIHIGAAVGTSLLLLVASRGAVVAMLLGLLIGLTLPWLALSVLRSRRQSKFLAQLPDTLQLLAGSLAAGYSLPQAMDSVVREATPPISVEFNRALVEARLGMPPEDALDGIAGRTDSQDFSWIVLAIRIQRDVGGNLAELLSSVADTLRERQRLRRQVSALSAEGKLSGIILGALPVVFTLYLVLVRPEYIHPLFATTLGLMLLGIGVIMLVIGAFWISRVIKVDV